MNPHALAFVDWIICRQFSSGEWRPNCGLVIKQIRNSDCFFRTSIIDDAVHVDVGRREDGADEGKHDVSMYLADDLSQTTSYTSDRRLRRNMPSANHVLNIDSRERTSRDVDGSRPAAVFACKCQAIATPDKSHRRPLPVLMGSMQQGNGHSRNMMDREIAVTE